MRRRFFKIILPVLIFGGVIILLAGIALCSVQERYRHAANQELTAILGTALGSSDPDALIANLRHPSTEAISAGAELLRQYGYFASDYAAESSERLFTHTLMLIVMTLVVFMVVAMLYFCWLDWRRSRQIAQLVDYLQDLNQRIYDLHLEENSEDELSILSNELYKIMVLLRESADNNRKSRLQLETALADISHQLRTPLTSMQVMVDNIYDEPKMPVAVRQDFLRSISRQVDSMSNLVMTLLNLAKFDNGSIQLHQLPVEARELLQAVRDKLEVLAELRGITIELSGDLQAQARLDRHWQIEALTNIVKNCLEHSPEHSPEGSTVDVSVTDSPLFLRLKVRDHGEGIAAEDLHHIFERFYKAKNSAADSVGIGLAFAKTIIEADNGQISVKSQEGQGTEFIITYYK